MGEIVCSAWSLTSRKRYPARKIWSELGGRWYHEIYTYGAPCFYTKSKPPGTTLFIPLQYMFMRRTSSAKVIIWSQHKTVKLAIATNLKCDNISDNVDVTRNIRTTACWLCSNSRRSMNTCNAIWLRRYLHLEWIRGRIHSWHISNEKSMWRSKARPAVSRTIRVYRWGKARVVDLYMYRTSHIMTKGCASMHLHTGSVSAEVRL